jgi:hypothetical protein
VLYRKLFRRKPFIKAQIDEVHLDQLAREWLEQQKNLSLDIHMFMSLYKTLGNDLATRILYLYFIEKKNSSFFQYVNHVPSKPFNNKKNIKFVIIPGMYYREYPEIGSDGKLFIDIAKRLGFITEIVNTDSLGMASQNSGIIKKVLDSSCEDEVWLISLSRGSLEVRGYLQKYANVIPKNIRGWINIGGICFGTKLADIQLVNWYKRLVTKIGCPILDIDYHGLAELTTYFPSWQSIFPNPKQLAMIHVIGMPLSCHMSKQLQARYLRLSEFGPNDGMILLQDYLKLPGMIYPLWGVDHLLRSPIVSELVYKLYYIIHHQCYKEFNSENQINSTAFYSNQLNVVHAEGGSI